MTKGKNMNAVNNLDIRNWFSNSAAAAASPSSVGGADFSNLLASLKGKSGENASSGTGASDFMDRLASRFPNVNFSEGTVGETPKEVQEYFGTEEGDNVAVESAAAEAIAGNSGLSAMFDNMLAAFEEAMGKTQAMDGAHVQRNIMVTSVSVRFSVSQIDSGTGETLSMNELKTAFSEFTDKLAEIAQKFFGDAETETGGDKSGEENLDTVAEDGQDADGSEGNPFAGFFGGGMSFSMHFSASFMQTQGMTGSGGEAFSANDFMDAFRKQGNFQNYMNSTFSASLFGGLMSGGSTSGAGNDPFTSMLNGGMGIFGMSSQGAWRQDGGFSFKFGESRNMITELLAMQREMSMNSMSIPAAPGGEPETATAAEPVEVAETAAVA
jgi:hypothetical protein